MRDALPGGGDPRAFELYVLKLVGSEYEVRFIEKACEQLETDLPDDLFERRKFPLAGEILERAYNVQITERGKVARAASQNCAKCDGMRMIVVERQFQEKNGEIRIGKCAVPCPDCGIKRVK